MKTLSRLIAMSLSVLTSTAVFAQGSIHVGGSSGTGGSADKVNVASGKISSEISALPAKDVTSLSATPASNRIPFRKFRENHPMFDQFAGNHPKFADWVFKNHDRLQDKGMSVQDAKDRFQRIEQRKQDKAQKLQNLEQHRKQVLANHPKFAKRANAHPRAMQQRMHALRSRGK